VLLEFIFPKMILLAKRGIKSEILFPTFTTNAEECYAETFICIIKKLCGTGVPHSFFIVEQADMWLITTQFF
jgi:hypothetical protein